MEAGVNDMLLASSNFTATTDLNSAISFSDSLYVVVATPSLPNGEYNHSQVDSLVENLKKLGKQNSTKQLVICCTTMPEYCDKIQQELADLNYQVSYNPEFIAQGTILRDQLKPDMVLIGESNKESGDIIQRHYEQMTASNPVFNRMSRTEAEICKISLNCFLTTKISFANMVGDIAINSGVRPDPILSAISCDSRISPKYLKYGFGFGGPCFPRDNRALAIYAKEKGIDAKISVASDEFNKVHLDYQVQNFIKDKNKTEEIVFDYVTYKPQSTMIVESQQLMFARDIAILGYNVIIKERQVVIDEIELIYGNLFKYEVRD